MVDRPTDSDEASLADGSSRDPDATLAREIDRGTGSLAPSLPQDRRFAPGMVLADRYRMVRRLGKGGMGEVHLADDLKLDQPVALKFLPLEAETDEGLLRLLFEEVKIARRISHPNCCRVFDLGEADGVHFLSMEGDELRVGPVSADSAHLLLGTEGRAGEAAVSPDGRWIASTGEDGTIRLWPMPDLEGEPFHTLPYEELLERLRALTYLRATRDDETRGGYRLEAGEFPGWETAPVW